MDWMREPDNVENASLDWVVDWMPRHRLGNSATPLASLNYTGFRIKFTKGATTAIKDVGDVATYTYKSADQSTDFGSAQATWDWYLVAS